MPSHSLTLHALNAQGQLTALLPQIETCLRHAEHRLQQLVVIPPIDVVLAAGRSVIPSLGHMGYCGQAGVIHLTFNPANTACAAHLGQPLACTLAHELHHALRWAGPGYGSTLGEALVSEALAIAFEHEAFDAPPQPWEILPDALRAPLIARARADWHRTDYDHDAWFFGTGMPFAEAGHGYGLAAYLAALWSAQSSANRAALQPHIAADAFRALL